jgi:hypothetical protein
LFLRNNLNKSPPLSLYDEDGLYYERTWYSIC